MTKYKVYTQQINQDVYEIEVPDEFPESTHREFAINKAKKEWKEDYGDCPILSVEKVS